MTTSPVSVALPQALQDKLRKARKDLGRLQAVNATNHQAIEAKLISEIDAALTAVLAALQPAPIELPVQSEGDSSRLSGEHVHGGEVVAYQCRQMTPAGWGEWKQCSRFVAFGFSDAIAPDTPTDQFRALCVIPVNSLPASEDESEPYEFDDLDRVLLVRVRKAIAYAENGDPAKDSIDEDEMVDAMRLLLQVVDAATQYALPAQGEQQ